MTMTATAVKARKTNGVLLRNRQIHDLVGQMSPSYVFGRHGLWPSLSNPRNAGKGNCEHAAGKQSRVYHDHHHQRSVHDFYRATQSAYGLSYRNSVRPSVCPSVTLVHCVHMVRPTTMISSPCGSPIILVSGISSSSQNLKGITPSEGVE